MLEPLRVELNAALGQNWEEWAIPRDAGEPWSDSATATWKQIRDVNTEDEQAAALLALNRELGRNYTLHDLPAQPRDPWDPGPTELHSRWWETRIARQKEMDASIAAKAEFEYLYDRPYEDRKIVRTAGPFTVESLSPHRTLGVDENDGLIDRAADTRGYYGREADFVPMILENLKTTGVHQAHKDDRLTFTSLIPWPGRYVCAEGRYFESGNENDDESTGPERRAAIFVGPEFGTVSRPDLVAATREAGRSPLRRTRCLRVQLRRALLGFRGLRPHSRTQGTFERRPSHGRRPQEHRQRQSLRHLRRAGHRDSRSGRRSDPGPNQRRGRLPPEHRRSPLRWPGRHRLLVHRYRLQTRRASSSAMPTSSARTTPTSPSKPPSKPRSTPKPGRRSTPTSPAPSPSPNPAASPSRSSTTSATR